jgi:hypothetical protein
MLHRLIETWEACQAQVAAETDGAESTISVSFKVMQRLHWRHIAALAQHGHVSPTVCSADPE